jgi:hypothetical protein
MKSWIAYSFAAAVAAGLALWQPASAEGHYHFPFPDKLEAPVVFQAAGPTAASIQSTVDQFRAALGGVNNGNQPGPLVDGRREINWDGGGSSATSPGTTPFDVFLITRGARMTTPGTGFVQAPPSGLATTFGNASYATGFAPFSPLRLFSPVGSNVTRVAFFLPGGGELPALTSAFGAVFSDVNQQNGLGFDHGLKKNSIVEYYGAHGELLVRSEVPASPGTATFSFFGIVFSDPRIARVRIVTGDVAPGGNDGFKDVVVMDDFIYTEPKLVQ